jgi:hypothetical protein
MSSTRVDFNPERKYQNRAKVTDSNKRCSLLRCEIYDGRKKIYDTSPAQAGHIKLFLFRMLRPGVVMKSIPVSLKTILTSLF